MGIGQYPTRFEILLALTNKDAQGIIQEHMGGHTISAKEHNSTKGFLTTPHPQIHTHTCAHVHRGLFCYTFVVFIFFYTVP